MSDLFSAGLSHTLRETALPLPGLRRGKVRDVYDLGDKLLMVATDRLSAFDVVLTTVPYKGQMLTQLASFWFDRTKDVAVNHIISQPDPAALLVKKCKTLPVEVVVRGYLTGSLWRDLQKGTHGVYGVPIDPGMKKDQAFPEPIITPSTKEEVGKHDEPISAEALIQRGTVSRELWGEICKRAVALFKRGQDIAKTRGLILVDTKYEFGLDGDELVLIDEIHTPDSSRFWEAYEYEARFRMGRDQKMLDKENVRQWLLKEHNWLGTGPAPAIADSVRVDIARIYDKAFERITGRHFGPSVGDPHERILKNLKAAGIL